MDGVTNSMTAINGAVTSLIEMSGTVLDAVLAHPVYAMLFAGTIISLAVGVIGMFKHA